MEYWNERKPAEQTSLYLIEVELFVWPVELDVVVSSGSVHRRQALLFQIDQIDQIEEFPESCSVSRGSSLRIAFMLTIYCHQAVLKFMAMISCTGYLDETMLQNRH